MVIDHILMDLYLNLKHNKMIDIILNFKQYSYDWFGDQSEFGRNGDLKPIRVVVGEDLNSPNNTK